MKAANSAWYWLAAGVLTLGLNGYYQDGGLQGLHQLAGQARAAMVEQRAQFNQAATLAEVALAEHARCRRQVRAEVALNHVMLPLEAQANLAPLQERMARMQVARVEEQVGRMQEAMARRDMERVRAEFQKGRVHVLANPGQVRLALPAAFSDVQLSIPHPPAVELMPN